MFIVEGIKFQFGEVAFCHLLVLLFEALFRARVSLLSVSSVYPMREIARITYHVDRFEDVRHQSQSSKDVFNPLKV